MTEKKHKIIFFGNGPLSEYVLKAIGPECEVIFHAHEKADLSEAIKIKGAHPEAHGVLASFGVLIPTSILEAFEPEGILNIHPSLLPLYRGASPIESAILNGDTEYGVSLMKLAPKMDAGPVYAQASISDVPLRADLKDYLYQTLAEMGVSLLKAHFKKPYTPVPQDDSKATYCGKFEKKDGALDPATEVAEVIFRKILAFQDFPKAKIAVYGKNCAILEAHKLKQGETALLPLSCADGQIIAIDRLQPDGKKPMDAKSFINGYAK